MTDDDLAMLAKKAACIEGVNFSPLTDDGDALRLAVKLRIDVAHARDYVVSGLGTADSMRRENGDDCAATRRAIVRAAAEVGRRMP